MEVISPTITIKVVGHQWYWSYEYSDYVNESGESIEFDVRDAMSSYRGSLSSIHCYYMDITPHLANGENSLVNTACESKAARVLNQIQYTEPQVISPTMKATLLESNHQETPIDGYCHFWDGANSMLPALNRRASKIVNTTQVVRNDHNDENLASKGDERIGSATVGLPKSPKTHGNGVSIVPALTHFTSEYVGGNALRKGSDTVNPLYMFRRYSTGCATQTSNVSDKLHNLRERSSESLIIDRNLIGLLSKPALLETAYNNIKSKPGNMTPGITPETLDGLNWEWILETSQLLKSGNFDFTPSRRIQIPKASGGKRPLSIGSPRDKIVQEAMRMILEAIYEPHFSEYSHGFRPARSCHSALKTFYTKFQGAQWLIEGDISKCFDTIDHAKLMNLIEQRIKDRRFTHYINKALKAGYFEFKVYQHNIVGTPQGSIISPILANIFLDQIDVFVENLRIEFDKGLKPRRNPIARYFEGRIARAKIKGDMELVRKLSLEARSHSYIDFEDPNFRRLTYLRYADDWIIGIRGKLQDTKDILAKVTEYCDSIGLRVSPEKTKITNLNQNKALFLGVELSRSSVTKFTRVTSSSSTKRVARHLIMTAPLQRVVKKLTDAGLIKNQEPAPRFLWLHKTHDQIIHLYNAVFRGYLNYYSFAHNYSSLVSLLNNILKQSAAKLLAAKFTLGTRSKVIGIFGPNLTSPNKISFLRPSYKANYLNFKVKSPYPLENIQGLYVSNKSLASLLNLTCSSCSSNYRVEMHHIRKMSDLNPKVSATDKMMINANRKQIPLCRACHMKLHKKIMRPHSKEIP